MLKMYALWGISTVKKIYISLEDNDTLTTGEQSEVKEDGDISNSDNSDEQSLDTQENIEEQEIEEDVESNDPTAELNESTDVSDQNTDENKDITIDDIGDYDNIEVLNDHIELSIKDLSKKVSVIAELCSSKPDMDEDIQTLMNLKNVVNAAISKNSLEQLDVYSNNILKTCISNISIRNKINISFEDIYELDSVDIESIYKLAITVFEKLKSLTTEVTDKYTEVIEVTEHLTKLLSYRSDMISGAIESISDLEISVSEIDSEDYKDIIKILSIEENGEKSNIQKMYDLYTGIIKNIPDFSEEAIEVINKLISDSNINYYDSYRNILNCIEPASLKTNSFDDSISSIILSPLIDSGLIMMTIKEKNGYVTYEVNTGRDIKRSLSTSLKTLSKNDLENTGTLLSTNISVILVALQNNENVVEILKYINDFSKPTNIKTQEDISNINNLLTFINAINMYINVDLIYENILMINALQKYTIYSINNYG